MRKVGRRTIEWCYAKNCLIAFLPMAIAVALIVVLGVKTYLAVAGATILLLYITKSWKLDLKSAASSVAGMGSRRAWHNDLSDVFESSGYWLFIADRAEELSLASPFTVFVPLLIGFALGESTPAMALSLSVLSFMVDLPRPQRA